MGEGIEGMRASYIENPKTWAEGFDFFVEITVRFSETDMFGHMNNTVSFTYFEYARIELFKKLGVFKLDSAMKKEEILVVADLQCDYLQQVFFDQTLKIYAKIAKIGNSSVDVHYLAKNASGESCFTGRGSIVQVNATTGKSVPLSEEQKRRLSGKMLQ